MLKAVIFDFDGVISDSEPLHYKAFAGAAAKFGFKLSKELYYKDYVGYCDRECFENMIRNFPDQLKMADIDEMVDIKTRLFDEMAKTQANIIPGVEQLINLLKDNQIRIAICSGAILRDILLMLNGSNIKQVFEIIVSDEDVSQGKPDPQGYTLALKKLNENGQSQIQPEQCIVVEDSHWGLMAAKAAGMKTIAVTNTYDREKLQMADKIVENLSEITFEDLQNLVKM